MKSFNKSLLVLLMTVGLVTDTIHGGKPAL